MKGTREAISVALFNLLANYAPLTALLGSPVSRTPVLWTASNTAQRPMLILFKGGPAEEFVQVQPERIGLTKYRIHWNLWLYLNSDPSNTVCAETAINNIADQIDAALQQGSSPPAYGERQTLGGLVNNCWIDGGSEWGREFEDNNITVFWKITAETGI